MKVVTRAQEAVTQATSLQELRAAQAVLLPAIMGATLTEAATVLGVGRATVSRLQADFRQAGTPAAPEHTVVLGTRGHWGGRRNALLTVAEEEEFLAPWLEQAKAGGAGAEVGLRLRSFASGSRDTSQFGSTRFLSVFEQATFAWNRPRILHTGRR